MAIYLQSENRPVETAAPKKAEMVQATEVTYTAAEVAAMIEAIMATQREEKDGK